MRWFPFVIWAIGGSNLTLRSRSNNRICAPHDSRVQIELQRFYNLARAETVVSRNTCVEDLPEQFLEAAERAPTRDLSVSEMIDANGLLEAHVQRFHSSLHIAQVDLLQVWNSIGIDAAQLSTMEVEGAQRYRSQCDILGISRLGRSMVWVFYRLQRNTPSIEVYSTVEGIEWKAFNLLNKVFTRLWDISPNS